MRLSRLFIMTFFFFIVLWSLAGYGANRSVEIQKIDAQIEQLEEEKRGFEARALRHEDYAEYLQFDQKALLETRRHLQLADENRYKASIVQEKIDLLKQKRAELQK